MSRLRIYRANGGDILDLLEYQKRREKREKQIENKDQLVRDVRKKMAGRKYAEELQAVIPGISQHSFRWMKGMLKGRFCI